MTERERILSLRKKDFIITPFKSSGPGGQSRNKTSTAIRIIHPASGARVEATEHKSQHQNKLAAWKRLRESDTFQMWLRKAIAEASISADQRRKREQDIAIAVERQMTDENILVEIQDESGDWTPLNG